MITKELLQFIEAELLAGQTMEGLLALLEGGGWTHDDVTEALRSMRTPSSAPVSIAEMRAKESPTLTPVSTPTPLSHAPIASAVFQKVAPPTPAPIPTLAPITPLASPQVVAPLTPEPQVPVVPTIRVAEKKPDQKPPEQKPKTVSSISIAELWAKQAEGSQEAPAVPAVIQEVLPAKPLEGTIVSALPASLARVGGASLQTKVLGSPQKKKIAVILVALFLLFGVVGIGFIFFGRLGPSSEKVFATMYSSVLGVQSFRYNGESKLDFTGEVTDPQKAGFTTGYAGSAKVTLKYDGRVDLAHGTDGVHLFGLTAQLKSGGYDIQINSNIEVRMLGGTYYVRITNPPELKDIDLSRLSTYWIAFTPEDIAKRLAGHTGGGGEYGAFGSTVATNTWRTVFAHEMPLSALEKVGDETLQGSATAHYRFSAGPKKLLTVILSVVGDIRGTTPALSSDDTERALAVLKDIEGDIWVDAQTYLPRKILFSHSISGSGASTGITMTGQLDSDQIYSEYNSPVSVATPHPVLTYDEFADDMKRQVARVQATGDARRVLDMEDIRSALEVYRANHDSHYPITLDNLLSDGLLPKIPTGDNGTQYLYESYVTRDKLTSKTRCAMNASSSCAFYHLGVTLENLRADVLANDADVTAPDIDGKDTKGCKGELDRACYDLAPVLPVGTSTASSTPK